MYLVLHVAVKLSGLAEVGGGVSERASVSSPSRCHLPSRGLQVERLIMLQSASAPCRVQWRVLRMPHLVLNEVAQVQKGQGHLHFSGMCQPNTYLFDFTLDFK